MPKAVGIDLGTTNSVVSVLEAGDPVVIPNSEGSRTTPSVVAFAKNGEVLVGEVAKRQAITNPDRTVRSVKRHMGTNWTIDIDGKKYTAQEISARTLMKLKRDAESYLGDTVTQAVITVPAYFDEPQRTATKEAGQIAGLEVLRIINEPTAAALAYGLDKEGADQTILVFDLGGGTFDVSVLEIGDGVFEVKATHGDTHLGGDDWDQRVIDWLVDSFKAAHGVDLSKDNMALQRLKEAAEKAKIELSQVQQTQINLPFITATAEGPLHLDEQLSRSKFQELTADLLDRCREPFEMAIKDAGLSKEKIDHVILVGGSTRMPAVQELVLQFTGKEPNKGVNPDEVVAVGAAIQAGVLKGDVKDVLLLDVTPLSLGIETKGGVMTKLIERNTTIPTRRTEVFTTAEDMQPSVEIHVLQGEREMAQFNKTLGKFQLVDLPPAPRGVPQIEVTFDIDANGIVHVSAKDRATGKEQSMTITGQSSLGKDQIDQMVRDAEAHAEEDRRRREEAEVRNNADTLVYQTEKLLREQGDKISGDDKTSVESALADLKTASAGTDVEAIKSATERLMTTSQNFTQKLYEAASSEQYAQTGGSAGGSTPPPNDDDVVDAEIVDEDKSLMSDSEPVLNEEGAPELVNEDELAAAAEEIEQDISAIAQQRDEYHHALAQRLQADFENFKKQTLRRNTDVVEHASSRLAEKLLPVLDAFDNAIIHGVDGVGPLHKALFDVLQKEGLEVIPTDGVPFDPNHHEAVLHEVANTADAEPVVSETLRTGYTWKGKVLRPAMVKVRG